VDQYSRWVAFLKVLLPLAALGLLSTLFLLSRKADPEATIPFADREIADRLRDQQITSPVFTGTSLQGDDIFISAERIIPPTNGKLARASNLEARLENQAGRHIRMRAPKGTLQDTVGRALFFDEVVIDTSTGYIIETELLTTQLDESAAQSPGRITAKGPLGDLDAGSMHISPKSNGEGLHIVFKNGVRLLYDPKQPER